MFNEINQHPTIKDYRTGAYNWRRQTYEDWQQAAGEFINLKRRHALPELAAAASFCEGQAARKQGLYEQALASFQEASRRLPDWPLIAEAMAAVYYALGRRPEAEDQLSRALKLDAKLVQARLTYSEMLCERNNYKAGEDVLKLGLKFNTGEPAFHCFLGHIALSDRRLESAERRYRRAITLMPDCADAYMGISSVRMLEGRKEEALTEINRALNFYQRNAPAFINRGLINYALNRRMEAETDFEHAIRLEPRSAQNYFRLGVFYWLQNQDVVIAERYLRLAVNCETHHSDYQSGLALLYLQIGRLEDAERYYREALLLNPEDFLALQGMGILALMGGEKEQAEAHFAQATAQLLSGRRYILGKISSQLHPRLCVH